MCALQSIFEDVNRLRVLFTPFDEECGQEETNVDNEGASKGTEDYHMHNEYMFPKKGPLYVLHVSSDVTALVTTLAYWLSIKLPCVSIYCSGVSSCHIHPQV